MAKTKVKLIALLAVLLLIAGGVYYFGTKDESSNTNSENPGSSQPDGQPNHDSNTVFDKSKYSLTDPASIWVIANKKNPLSATFVPSNLQIVDGAMLSSEAAAATESLISAAKKDGANFNVISGYRSYSTQKSVYDGYVKADGQTAADEYSARPGYSEHQTGLAADLGDASGSCDLEICFAETAGGIWLAAHAHEYGFIIRYAKDKTAVTGYQYEPWHIRYVGKGLASELNKNKQTMEEFFGLPAAPGY